MEDFLRRRLSPVYLTTNFGTLALSMFRRLLADQAEDSSRWAAMSSVSAKIGGIMKASRHGGAMLNAIKVCVRVLYRKGNVGSFGVRGDAPSSASMQWTATLCARRNRRGRAWNHLR